MSLEQKAKTFYELGKEWMKTKVDDSINNEKWIRLSVAQQEIDDCRTSWQNLKDTIPKFDHKISFLENQIKSDNELIEISQRARHELERERGLLKQKLHEMAVATSLEHTHPSPEFWKGWNKAIDTVLAVLEGKEKAKPT